MLAYRHAFHAGNHADVLKHICLVQVLDHLNQKEKAWHYLDTHAGAGGYALQGRYAQQNKEHAQGVVRLLATSPGERPAAVARYLELVQRFNGKPVPEQEPVATEAAQATPASQASPKAALKQYPGSPALAHMLARPQDQLRLFELHPTEHKILNSFLGSERCAQVRMADGFEGIKGQWPPTSRRGALLIDPPYEVKTDYTRTLAALREALTRFADGVVMVWLPQLQLLQSAQLPQRLKAAADSLAKKGWVHAKLTVTKADEHGYGMLGSSVFIANPPHTLFGALQPALPWLAKELGQFDGAKGFVERSMQA